MVLDRQSNKKRWQLKLYFLDKKYKEIDKNGITKKALFYDKCVERYAYIFTVLSSVISFVIVYIIAVFLVALAIYVIKITFSLDPTSLSNFIVLIVSFFGTMFNFIKQTKQDVDDIKIDSSLFIMRYLIELTRGNKDCKIFKNELSIMLLSYPDKFLKLLYRVQKNIDKNEEEAREIIVFLLEYLRNNMKLGGETLEAKESNFAYDFIKCSSVNISEEE